MPRIGLHTYETAEVELDGHVYRVRPGTRSVTEKATELESKRENLPDANDDDLIAVFGEALDLRLESVAKGQPKASTSLKRLWERDEVSIQQIMRLLADIAETDRPT